MLETLSRYYRTRHFMLCRVLELVDAHLHHSTYFLDTTETRHFMFCRVLEVVDAHLHHSTYLLDTTEQDTSCSVGYSRW